MRLKAKLLSALGVGVLAGAFFAAPAGALPPPPVDVSTHHVACDTLVGSIKFATALSLGGTSTNAITLKATVDGCVDQESVACTLLNCNNNVNLAPSKLSGILNATNNDCLGLSGLSTGTTGTATVAWKTNAKELGSGLSEPKIYDDVVGIAGAGHAATITGVNQTFGGTFDADGSGSAPTWNVATPYLTGDLVTYDDGSGPVIYSAAADNTGKIPSTNTAAWSRQGPAENQDSWGGSYGLFQIGASIHAGGTTAPTVTGSYHVGALKFNGNTGQSKAALALQCFGKGIKGINFGIGAFGNA